MTFGIYHLFVENQPFFWFHNGQILAAFRIFCKSQLLIPGVTREVLHFAQSQLEPLARGLNNLDKEALGQWLNELMLRYKVK